MKPCLITVRPLNTKTGARVDVLVADGPTADTYGTGGLLWEPAISARPTMSLELMSPEMDGKVQAGQARFSIALRELRGVANPIALYWGGASVVIHSAGILEGPTAVPDFWGYVTAVGLDLETGSLSITAEVSTAFIDKPLLTLEFDGSGGAGGDAALRGTLYPVGHGVVKNLQPIFFDTTRNIGMVDGYGNTTSIDWLGEGLNSLGAPVNTYATYAALAAAIDAGNVPRGRWAIAIVAGGPSYVGLGAPPTGIITVHATFSYNRLGAIMKRILTAPAHANVAAARVDTAAFDALDAAVPRAVHYWTSEQRNVKDLLEALAQSCNATPLVSFQNRVTVTRAVAGASVLTLNRNGFTEPRVINWQSAEVYPPYYILKARAARPASTLTTDQVNYVDTIIDRGLYAAATAYRAGNVVWLSDGSQWLYVNATAGSGNAPPAPPTTVNAYWQRLQPPKTASDFAYNDTMTVAQAITSKSSVNYQTTFPLAAVTIEDDQYFDQANGNRVYRRLPGNGTVEIGGSAVTIGGTNLSEYAWTPADNATTTNFNARNDRLATAIAAPTVATDGTATTKVINTDGSVDLSFVWGWSGDEATIDGFVVVLRSSATNEVYSLGSVPTQETPLVVPAARRKILLAGVPANRFYTWGVYAYRVVDQDVAATGLIVSPTTTAAGAGEKPFQPSATVAFAGNVSGTVGGTGAGAVSTGATAANNGLNSDGTVQANKVLTSSLVSGAVTRIVGVQNSGSAYVAVPANGFATIASATLPAVVSASFIVSGAVTMAPKFVGASPSLTGHRYGALYLEYAVNAGPATPLAGNSNGVWLNFDKSIVIAEQITLAIQQAITIPASPGDTVKFNLRAAAYEASNGEQWQHVAGNLNVIEVRR